MSKHSSQPHSERVQSATAKPHRPTKLERYRRSFSGVYLDSRYLLISMIVGTILQLVLIFIAYAWLIEQVPALRSGYFALIVSLAIVVYFGHIVYSRIPLLQQMMAPTQDPEDTTSVEPIFSGDADTKVKRSRTRRTF